MDSTILRPARVLMALALAVAIRSLPAIAEEPPLRLPPNVTYNAARGSPGPVIFRHDSHFELADGKCTACHPQPFSILHSGERITHAEMDAGKKCGVCHNGKQASGVQDACDNCHKEAEKP